MPHSQELFYWPLDEVRVDLACPSCGYNLRGQRGASVNCPECGRTVNVVELLMLRADRHELFNPLEKEIWTPASWGLGLAMIVGLYLWIPTWWDRVAWFPQWVIAAAVLLWACIVLFVWATHRNQRVLAAIGLAHVVTLLGVLAVVAAVAFVVFVVGWFLDPPGFASALSGKIALSGLVLVALGLAAFWAYRRLNWQCKLLFIQYEAKRRGITK